MVKKDKTKCDVCGKLFDSAKQMYQHKHHVHETTEKNDLMKAVRLHGIGSWKPSKKLIIVMGASIVIAILASIGGYYYYGIRSNTPSTLSSSLSPLTINGIQCNANEQLLFHVHAHLDIFVNGQTMYVPPQIGIIEGKCFYWLHTHDGTGIIHIESPVQRDFTLDQFFDLWSKKVNNSAAFVDTFGGKNRPNIYINGHQINSTDYRNIKLHAHDEIALVFGKSPSSIPSRYDFPDSL